MSDPEPDRAQIEATTSKEWEQLKVVTRILELGEAIEGALGCEAGLHDWTNEYIGDPPGPNRRLVWSRTRVRCRECGIGATLVYDEEQAAWRCLGCGKSHDKAGTDHWWRVNGETASCSGQGDD